MRLAAASHLTSHTLTLTAQSAGQADPHATETSHAPHRPSPPHQPQPVDRSVLRAGDRWADALVAKQHDLPVRCRGY